MDHFPTPKGTKPVNIPCISKEKYVYDGDFSQYPVHRGWTLSEIYEDPNFGFKDPQVVAEFIQTWLYFGFLTEVFKFGVNVEFNINDFIRQHDRQKYVTTTALPELIEKWRIKDNGATGDDVADRSLRIMNATTGVEHFITRRFEDMDRYIGNSKTSLTWPLISASIIALYWTLNCVFDKVYDLRWRTQPRKWKSVRFLTDRLRQAGWCKGEIARLLNDLEFDGLYYVGCIESPRRDQDHEMCNETACYGRAVDESNYVTKHTSTCKGCINHVAPNDVVEIIKRGNTPIISWHNSKITVIEVSQKSEIPYLAISHVWSDGMGNPKENSLPACQLSRIQEYVDRLYSRTRAEQKKNLSLYGPTETREPRDPKRKAAGFWMDTLCVPVHDEMVRNVTISKMRTIYERADRVLVLDSWIQKHLSHSSSITESAVRLYLSNWQHRLWTLQEGVLAQNLYFQFNDGPQTLSELGKQQDKDRKTQQGYYSSIVGSTLIHVPMVNFGPILDEDPSEASVVDKFAPAVSAILMRNTTRKSDETICLATLLRMDPTPFLNIKGPKKDKLSKEEKHIEEQYRCVNRMEVFMETIETFDQWFIFHSLPRLDTEGFRWAPRSFLGQTQELVSHDGSESEYDDYKATLKRDRGGLQIKYPGIKLNFVDSPVGKEFSVSKNEDNAFWFRFSVSEDLSWDPATEYVLISRYPVDDTKQSKDAIIGMRRGEDKEGNWRLQFLTTAQVYWPETSLLDMITKGLDAQTIENVPVSGLKDETLVVGELIEDRLWCLI